MKFSVIIPVYNRAERVRHAVDSVLKQDHTALEVIVVDDGSTDETGSVVKTINDARVIYLRQENKERGAARNAGMDIAQGDYLTFLDSDDEFLPGHLSGVKNFIEANPGNDVYCTAYLKENNRGTERIAIPSNIPDALCKGNFLSCNGVFLSGECASQFRFNEDRRMAGLEDWELWLRIAEKKKMIGAQLYTSRMNHHDERSVLQTTPAQIENRFEVFFDAVRMHPQFKTIYASGESYMALHLALTGKYKDEARRHLKAARKANPGIIFTKRYYAILKRL